jgi:hypothetical protein
MLRFENVLHPRQQQTNLQRNKRQSKDDRIAPLQGPKKNGLYRQ